MIKDNKVYQYYTELPQWAKGAVVLGGAAVIFLIGKKIYEYAFPSEEKKRQKELTQNVEAEIIELSKKQKPSFSDSQYVLFANTIYNSMRYCAGDDYGTVEATMKRMKNDLDVAKLIKAFGVRKDFCFGIPTGEFDLFTYIQKELGNDYGGLTNYRVDRINADWDKKGITNKI
jgi:hypothetical protein